MLKTLIKTTMVAGVMSTAGLTVPVVAHAGTNWKALCRPFVNAQTHGSDNDVRIAARFCAEITSIIRGHGNDIDIEVIGPNRVSVTSLDGGNVGTFRVRGADTVLGVITMNGGQTLLDWQGDGIEGDIINDGCDVKSRARGTGSRISIQCSSD